MTVGLDFESDEEVAWMHEYLSDGWVEWVCDACRFVWTRGETRVGLKVDKGIALRLGLLTQLSDLMVLSQKGVSELKAHLLIRLRPNSEPNKIFGLICS